MIIKEKVSYGDWDNNYRISNGIVELIVTADIGPRIIHYGFVGKKNMFCQVKEHMGKTGSDEWRIYGGHRLWHSPEAKPRTYHPDNFPVEVQPIQNGVEITQSTEDQTGIRKQMQITLEPNGTKVEIAHFLTNEGVWDIELAAWALTVMDTGGIEIVPQTLTDTDLLPNRMISLWPYTKLNDPRVTWGEKYILLRQDPNMEQPFKFGISNSLGWAAYANHHQLFVKKYQHIDDALYPDYSGSSYETYTTNFMLEMESLSPLVILQPNDTIEHIETWELYDNVKAPKKESDVDEYILPYIK